MGLYLRNHPSDVHDVVEARIFHEHVENDVVVTLPLVVIQIPERAVGSFYWLYLCCNADGSNPEVIPVLQPDRYTPAPRPNRDLCRVISAWGTEPDDDDLIKQIQSDRVVAYLGDYTFNLDLETPGGASTGGEWKTKFNYNGWPHLLTAFVYYRAEARKMSDLRNNMGLAQVNIGGVVMDGQNFRTQVKGLTTYDQPEASLDWMRCAIEPGGSYMKWMVPSSCRGAVLFSGYELLPT